MEPRLFTLIREFDESGVSGPGRVLDGVIFGNGKVVVNWRVEGKPSSMAIHDSLSSFLDIHVKSHPLNKSRLVWLYGSPPN